MPGVEVTKKNFPEYISVIKEQIDQSVFVSIDLEFTGLTINSHTRSSLFDTAEERYKKAKRNVSEFTVAQFGLTAYQSVGVNRYDAFVYNFYLCPEAGAGIDTRFMMQASAVQFLSHYSFDFNKMLHEGIPFLNQKQRETVRTYWKSHLRKPAEFDSMQRDQLRRYCVLIARWLVQARDGDIFTLDKTTEQGDIPNEILHERLIHRIENIWPKPSTDEVLIVEKVSDKKRQELMNTAYTSTTDKEKEEIKHLYCRRTRVRQTTLKKRIH